MFKMLADSNTEDLKEMDRHRLEFSMMVIETPTYEGLFFPHASHYLANPTSQRCCKQSSTAATLALTGARVDCASAL